MTEHYDSGQLRAYLEDMASLPLDERSAVEAHLAICSVCKAHIGELQALEGRVTNSISLVAPAQAPDIQAALMKMRAKLREETATNVSKTPASVPAPQASIGQRDLNKRSRIMQSLAFTRPGSRRVIFSTLVTAALVISFITVPALRAAADSLLQTFRARSVVFLPVDSARMQQLSDLGTDPTALFLSKPVIVGSPKTTVVASADAASRSVGFKPEQPSTFPGALTSTDIKVHESTKVQAQLNVATIRELMQTLGVNDVTLPDALGSAPITADVPAFTESTYSGTDYEITLVQGRSPTVTMPAGVDLAQLGRVGLRLVGMQPQQADEMSRQINWSSTLVVPFPASLRNIVRVQVGNSEGLMVSAYGGSDSKPSQPRAAIYWQSGDHFYVLAGHGDQLNNDMMLLAARSIK